MIKIDYYIKDNEANFEIQDETENFEELSMELSILLKYAYDSMLEAATEGGAKDPEREAKLFIDSITNEAVNGEAVEQNEADQRRSLMHIVDNYMAESRAKEDKGDCKKND